MQNIIKGKKADEKLIQWLSKIDGFESITEIKDGTMNRHRLKGSERLQNDINRLLGIDYVVVMNGQTLYIDTKMQTYNKDLHGDKIDGKVENIIIQLEKKYPNATYKGWSNDENKWTEYILLMIDEMVYVINYKKLVEYVNQISQVDIILKAIDIYKHGSIEKIMAVPLKTLEQLQIVKASPLNISDNHAA